MSSRGRDVVPSLFTLSGLLLAVWSMTLVTEGRFEAAAWVLFAAACVDVLDGAVARTFGAITPFGQQMDSLCDLVTAGVAPAFLIHQLYFAEWGAAGVLISAAWAGSVAIRLARFNTTPSDPLFFVGVPCPVAATVVCQYGVFSRATWGDNGSPWVVAVTIAVLGALMVSHVPYWKSATLLRGEFRRHAFGPGLAVTALASIAFPRQALFVGTTMSVIGAVALHAAALAGWPRARSSELEAPPVVAASVAVGVRSTT